MLDTLKVHLDAFITALVNAVDDFNDQSNAENDVVRWANSPMKFHMEPLNAPERFNDDCIPSTVLALPPFLVPRRCDPGAHSDTIEIGVLTCPHEPLDGLFTLEVREGRTMSAIRDKRVK